MLSNFKKLIIFDITIILRKRIVVISGSMLIFQILLAWVFRNWETTQSIMNLVYKGILSIFCIVIAEQQFNRFSYKNYIILDLIGIGNNYFFLSRIIATYLLAGGISVMSFCIIHNDFSLLADNLEILVYPMQYLSISILIVALSGMVYPTIGLLWIQLAVPFEHTKYFLFSTINQDVCVLYYIVIQMIIIMLAYVTYSNKEIRVDF